MQSITADHGSLLPLGSSALVVDQTGKLSFHMPNESSDMDISPMVQLLVAVLIRSEDQDWVAEMIESLEAADWI